MTVWGNSYSPAYGWADCLIRDQKGIFGKGVTVEIWRKCVFWDWGLAELCALSGFLDLVLAMYLFLQKGEEKSLYDVLYSESLWYEGRSLHPLLPIYRIWGHIDMKLQCVNELSDD